MCREKKYRKVHAVKKRAYGRQHYATGNREKQREYRALPSTKMRLRKWNLANSYGLTLTEYTTMLRKQKYRCAICQRYMPKGNRNRYVDHDHQTGQVRGILCPGCNQSLGRFGDTIPGLMRAIKYLRRAQKRAQL
jgi:Pyruvate/2-oxoacid:ferredoxin oxidoreductase delta subunit